MAYRSSIRDDLSNIPQFGGSIYYVSKLGDDANYGNEPYIPFKTINKALSIITDGDAIIIRAGNYQETGLTLNTNNAEMWFEIGSQISPDTGDALTINSNFNRITCREGALKINCASGYTGVVINGSFCYMSEIRVDCSSSGNIGFNVIGNGSDLRRCRCSDPLNSAFIIQGDAIKLENCCTGGNSSSSSKGYWITNTSDKARIKNCGSQGHIDGGIVIDSGSTNGVIESTYSGGGDGKFKNNATTNNTIISNMHYQGDDGEYNSPLVKIIEFQAGVTQYNLFKVKGSAFITDIGGYVLTDLPATTTTPNLEITSTNASVEITDVDGGPNISGAVAESILVRLAESTEPLYFGNPNNTPVVLENIDFKSQKNSILCIEDSSADTYITLNLTNALSSGSMSWACRFLPLSANGYISVA